MDAWLGGEGSGGRELGKRHEAKVKVIGRNWGKKDKKVCGKEMGRHGPMWDELKKISIKPRSTDPLISMGLDREK